MEKDERVIKHLEMIQGVVNRLGSNSFMLKGWSMTIIAAAIILISRYGLQNPFLLLTFIVPIAGFWILDGYFLWQERLFRKVYDEIRKQKYTDFAMNPMEHAGKSKITWVASMFSKTLNIFYGIEVIFVFAVFCILK